MIYFLFHHDRWNNEYLLKALGNDNVECVYSHDYKQWIMRHWRHFGGSLKAVRKSNEGDIIITWHYLQAVLAWWICKFTGKHRKFICINVLLKHDSSAKNILHRYLCKKAFLSKNFKATVNSNEYGAWLNKQLRIDVKYTLLRDVYHDYYATPQFKESSHKNIVFNGGASGRDWEMMLSIAQLMPHVRFYMIMPDREYHPFISKHKNDIPDNIKIDFNIEYRDFMERLCQSSLVVLPLSINAPAGLTVMYQAAGNRRMVITSNTEAMKGYFGDYQLCGSNPHDWCDKINYYLQHEDERIKEANRFHDFITSECTEEKYANTVKELVLSFQKDQ